MYLSVRDNCLYFRGKKIFRFFVIFLRIDDLYKIKKTFADSSYSYWFHAIRKSNRLII